jgi:small subunit ribosomal protein S3
VKVIEKKFIADSIRRVRAKDCIKKELGRAGISEVGIQRTTLATRITVTAENPGLIIGKKGRNIRELSATVEKILGIDNPQIEVNEISDHNLEPTVIARWVGRMIERGLKPKRVIQRALDRIMSSGAMGGEVIIKGKIMGKGAKARKARVTAGYLKKAGDSTKYVREAKSRALLKQGIIGITVRIVPNDVVFPDKIDIKKVFKVEEPEEKKAEESKAEKEEKTEEKKKVEKSGSDKEKRDKVTE